MIGHEARFHEDLSRRFRLYAALFGNPNFGDAIRFAYLRRTVGGLALAGARILDAGAGSGQYAFWAAKRWPASEVTACTLDPRSVERGRRIAGRLGLGNLRFEEGDVAAWRDGSPFGLVLLVDVLEHVEDDASAAANLARQLAPGGRLYAHVPAIDFRSFRARFRNVAADHPGHVRPGYTLEGLESVLTRAGLAVEGRGYTWGPLAQLLWEANATRHLKLATSPLSRILLPLEMALPKGRGNGVFVLARATGPGART